MLGYDTPLRHRLIEIHQHFSNLNRELMERVELKRDPAGYSSTFQDPEGLVHEQDVTHGG